MFPIWSSRAICCGTRDVAANDALEVVRRKNAELADLAEVAATLALAAGGDRVAGISQVRAVALAGSERLAHGDA